MTKATITERNRDVADYLAQTTLNDNESDPLTDVNSEVTKSPQDSARLAQRLATDSSWAERYVPTATPTETEATPSASLATNMTAESDYMTPEEAPPTYELATSTSATTIETPAGSEIAQTPRGALPPFSQPRPHEMLGEFSQPRPHDLLPPFSSSDSRAPVQRTTSSSRSPFGKHYEQHETSNSIHGTFTVWDSLDLSTTSGSIGIRLDVRPGPNPARVTIKSKSGSITIHDEQCDAASSRRAGRRQKSSCNSAARSSRPGLFSSWFNSWGQPIAEPPAPSSDDPRKQAGQHVAPTPEVQNTETSEDETFAAARVIHAIIESENGSVNAYLVLTAKSNTRISTTNGSINLRMVSTGSGPRALSKLEQEDSRLTEANLRDLTSVVSTQTKQGSQHISITNGASDTSSGAIISACRGHHHSLGSASINVHYPREWTGLVHASSGGSGSCNVRGFGLEYDKRGNREIYAWRGVDEPDLAQAVELRGDQSGSVYFSC